MAGKFLYEQIYETLKNRIEDGTYPEESRLPGSRALAAEFDTTVATVVKAFSLLEERKYLFRKPKSGTFVHPASFRNAHNAEHVKTGLVGAIVFDSSVSVYWSQVLSGMEEAVSRQGKHLVVGHSDHSIDKALRYVHELTAKGIDGFIFVPIDMADADSYERENLRVIRELDETGRPYVLFDRHLSSVKRPCVGPDSYETAVQLVRHLMEQGVSTPLCVSLYYGSVIGDREKAFCDVLVQKGIPNPKRRIVRLDTYRVTDALTEDIIETLGSFPDADGIFCVNSNVLNGVTEALLRMNAARRPLVVGFHEIDMRHPEMVCAWAVQPIGRLGRAAGDLVVAMIDDEARDRQAITQIFYLCRLKLRE